MNDGIERMTTYLGKQDHLVPHGGSRSLCDRVPGPVWAWELHPERNQPLCKKCAERSKQDG